MSALPVHEDSGRWLATMAAASTNLHPDFGPPSYGIPLHVVDGNTPTVAVRFRYADESDRRRYPLTRAR